LPAKYPLKETKSDQVEKRTEKNLTETDATLVLAYDQNYDKGSLYTIEQCKKYRKPFLEVDLSLKANIQLSMFKDWILQYKIQHLNIAGPRESFSPGIYKAASELLNHLLKQK
jgi:hypothetical protein